MNDNFQYWKKKEGKQKKKKKENKRKKKFYIKRRPIVVNLAFFKLCLLAISKGLIRISNQGKRNSLLFDISKFSFRKLSLFATTKGTLTLTIKENNHFLCMSRLLSVSPSHTVVLEEVKVSHDLLNYEGAKDD